MISRTPYHRTCFRCARCNNQLTPGNFYETEKGQYCCETCPDEEQLTTTSPPPLVHQAYTNSLIHGHEEISQTDSKLTTAYQRSLSDEEKTEQKVHMAEKNKSEPQTTENISQTAQMRLNFMAAHLLTEDHQEEFEDSSSNNNDEYSSGAEGTEEVESSIPDGNLQNRASPKGSPINKKNGDGLVDATNTPFDVNQDRDSMSIDTNVDINPRVCEEINENEQLEDRGEDIEEYRKINNKISFDTATNEAETNNHHYAYLDDKNVLIRQDTKDTLGLNIDANKCQEVIIDTSQCLSLVQRRLKIFENSHVNKAGEELKYKSSSSLVKSEESLPDNANKRGDEFCQDFKFKNKKTDTDAFSASSLSMKEEKNNIKEETDSLKNSEISKAQEKLNGNPPIVKKRVKKAGISMLNAKGIDLSDEKDYPEELNPFKSDEESDEEMIVSGVMKDLRTSKVSTNPFGSSEDEEEDEPKIVEPPRPAVRNIGVGNKGVEEDKEVGNEAPTKRRLIAPQINLNPFWSDDEGEDSEDDCGAHEFVTNTPVPKPRTIK